MLRSTHIELLEQLAVINTVTPMETGMLSNLTEANTLFSTAAVTAGMEVLYQGPGQLSEQVPISILRQQQALGEDFLNNQPCLVLGLGDWKNKKRTVMFNFHMDTVGPHLSVLYVNDVFYGRGVADNKGPGVAVLAAIETWVNQRTADHRLPGVLIQCVGGEEGGALGIYGTRWLMEQGYYGYLNMFVIPSSMKYFDESTTTMTAELRVEGSGSTDDSPWAGDNATLILASLVQSIAKYLVDPLEKANVKMTVAGIHTGDTHNRVYGQGRALFNFSYSSMQAARQTENLFEKAVKIAKQKFVTDFSSHALFRRTTDNLEHVLLYTWLKKGLPVLNNRSNYWQSQLIQADITRHIDNEFTFTCDAMWGQKSDCYSIMFGPGSLTRNGAHTDKEYISLTDLNEFSRAIFRLLNLIDQS